MHRSDYCPMSGEPCQSLCDIDCGTAPSLSDGQAAQVLGALVLARDGYVSEAATGQRVRDDWREETVRKINVAIDAMQRLRGQQRKRAG